MCKKLIEQGVPGIQFFTMDKPEGTKKVLQEFCNEKKLNYLIAEPSIAF